MTDHRPADLDHGAGGEGGREDHHHHGPRPGAVVGHGLGGLVLLAGLLILVGPFLLAPLTLAVQAWRAVEPGSWQPWAAAIAVGLGVLGVQFWLVLQRSPAVRLPAVLVFSLVWAAGAWLFFTRGAREQAREAAAALNVEAPGLFETITQAGWITIAVVTLLYAALYLFLLHKLDHRPWAQRLQVIGPRRPDPTPDPAVPAH